MNEKGFSLIECIFSLLILSTILAFFPLLIKAYERIDHAYSTEKDFEWNLFLMELRKELRTSNGWVVTGNSLYLNRGQEVVVYEKYNQSIRRRVDGKGHEVVLQKVKQINFNSNKNEIILHVQFVNNHSREAHLFFSLRENEE
ncbi:ComGF family competence protein [Heyndrickxia sporothermodurans]|nr:competence type IV pilus minor pilin ComGF [Heyndrickxia sporothermodurans]MEB6547520.1 ComGF family competence protein [Heyndrickxia sporothermodurans]MED3654208.1 competence type IV pilus minor pilin ComGF [Heyndrickxia sporothermodurans]MED3781927.1 competence type IV pilus minor pilin ComGF [Heyndrickxia sporothermodurans]